MKTITITTPDDHVGLTPRELRDLAWLLRTFDEWLLYAEPATHRELARALKAVGSKSSTTQVVKRLGELRRRFGGTIV